MLHAYVYIMQFNRKTLKKKASFNYIDTSAHFINLVKPVIWFKFFMLTE